MADDLYEQSILSLHKALLQGSTTSVALVQTALDRIEKYDQAGPQLNAMLHINERVLEVAQQCDAQIKAGQIRSLLHGLPIVIKDNFLTCDMPTTAGCKALQGLPINVDAWQVRRLRQAGAVLIGKSTLHELACGLTNASSMSGYTRNPYQPEHIPGGSSGGTAVAVAASYAVAGLGSDTSGSIRVPSACQNLFGLRPTWGLSSRTGMVPLCPSQDIGGPLARNVKDLAIMLDLTVGVDPGDAATHQSVRFQGRSFLDSLDSQALKGTRIGVLESMFGSRPHEAGTTAQVNAALESMQSLGAVLIPIESPINLDQLLPLASLTGFEFRDALATFLVQTRAPVGSLTEILALGWHHPDVDRVLRLRDQPLAGREHELQAVIEQRTAIRRMVAQLFDKYQLHALAYPTLRCGPVRLGEPQPGENCALSPILGWPAISIPAGFLTSGLPVGLDLLGPAYSDPFLLSCAYHWEQTGHRRIAPAGTPPLC